MAKSNMNNLDSMALAKLPYNITQKTGGYSHNMQMYNLMNRNLNCIMSFRVQKQSLRFMKLKHRTRRTLRHLKIKKKNLFYHSLQVRKTTVNFIHINNLHLMTYTTIYPQPYLFKLNRVWRIRLESKKIIYKNFIRAKKL